MSLSNVDKLRDVKSAITRSGYYLDYKKCVDVDLTMMQVLENIENGDFSDLSKYFDGDSLNALVIYYYSKYSDNNDILTLFSKNKLPLKNAYAQYNLYLFDKRFSKYFTDEELVTIFKKYDSITSVFYDRLFNKYAKRSVHSSTNVLKEEYYSIIGGTKNKDKLNKLASEIDDNFECRYSDSEQEKIMKDFVKIFKTKPNLMASGIDNYHNLISPKFILVFGADMILNFNSVLMDCLKDCYGLSVENLVRIKNMLVNDPKFLPPISLTNEVFEVFSDNDLVNMSQEDAIIYDAAIKEGTLKRVKELVDKGYSFSSSNPMVNSDFLDMFDDDTIFMLSDAALRKISNLKVSRKFRDGRHDYEYRKAVNKVVKKELRKNKVMSLFR